MIVNGQIFKCNRSVLQYCNRDLIDKNGDFVASTKLVLWTLRICTKQREECKCDGPHAPTLEDFVRRILTKLESHTFASVRPSWETESMQDSCAASLMGLLPCRNEDLRRYFC